MNLLNLGRLGKAHAARSFAGVGFVGLIVAGFIHLPTSNSQSVDRTIELPIAAPIISSDATSEQVDVKEQPVRLNSAQIALKEAKVAVSLSQAQLAQARINLIEFQAKHNSAKILSAQGKVSRKQADLAVASYKLAQLQHSSASIGLQDSQTQLIAAKADLNQDLFQSKFSDATVVTLYLLPELNVKIRPQLLSQLKPGTRIVSHAFDMGDWKPVRAASPWENRTEQVQANGQTSTIYFWTVPANPPANLRAFRVVRQAPISPQAGNL